MKYLILLIAIFLNAFDVEFIKVYKKYIIPKEDAVLIKTKKIISFPFNFIKTSNGYILYGDIDQINMYLENDFYAPDDAKFENIKIAFIDKDKIQYDIIKKIKRTYKTCQLKKIEFLTLDEDQIITKPSTIKEKVKIILKCK